MILRTAIAGAVLIAASIARGDAVPPTTTAAAVEQPKASDDDGEPRLSLPTESDRAAWLRSGFRLGVGLAYGKFDGVEGAPSGRLLGAVLHAGLRLDRDWSIIGTLEFESASQHLGLSGLRYSGTVDPTWHVTPHVSLAIGVGFGGLVEGNTGRPDASPLGSTLSTSYTFPNAHTPLPSCSGTGVVSLARVEWAWVMGPRASTSIAFETIGQWTDCIQATGMVEADTGQPIVRQQYWANVGATLAWGVSWR